MNIRNAIHKNTLLLPASSSKLAHVIVIFLLAIYFLISVNQAYAFTPNTDSQKEVVHNKNDEQSQFVNRAIVTSNIDNREPVDNLNDVTLTEDTSKVFFFTEVMNKSGETVTHRWFLNGRLEAEVKLNIGANRWRTYSSKNLVSIHKGNWQVELLDSRNNLIATRSFKY